ncbi:hypothetical protein MESS2_1620012 [Mesorhizobium metallidurans STM 2683]|uniref:Uncharacterized protein n=1 Tax=Mesorhizobium metallidurans STM 2683 TaxID=1297569 RepID=M5EMS0_9HYPH|nr:hypothetical protein MESS2_1620012 [Mesorhizobium metallidurans STM 2683]
MVCKSRPNPEEIESAPTSASTIMTVTDPNVQWSAADREANCTTKAATVANVIFAHMIAFIGGSREGHASRQDWGREAHLAEGRDLAHARLASR